MFLHLFIFGIITATPDFLSKLKQWVHLIKYMLILQNNNDEKKKRALIVVIERLKAKCDASPSPILIEQGQSKIYSQTAYG